MRTSKPFTDGSFLEIERAVLAGRPHSTCGGRPLNDDIVDILYTLLVGGVDGPPISGPAPPAAEAAPCAAGPCLRRSPAVSRRRTRSTSSAPPSPRRPTTACCSTPRPGSSPPAALTNAANRVVSGARRIRTNSAAPRRPRRVGLRLPAVQCLGIPTTTRKPATTFARRAGLDGRLGLCHLALLARSSDGAAGKTASP
jgi:hypothetical protein